MKTSLIKHVLATLSLFLASCQTGSMMGSGSGKWADDPNFIKARDELCQLLEGSEATNKEVSAMRTDQGPLSFISTTTTRYRAVAINPSGVLTFTKESRHRIVFGRDAQSDQTSDHSDSAEVEIPMAQMNTETSAPQTTGSTDGSHGLSVSKTTTATWFTVPRAIVGAPIRKKSGNKITKEDTWVFTFASKERATTFIARWNALLTAMKSLKS